MQRTITLIVAGLLAFMLVLNVALLLQNLSLRQQLAATAAQQAENQRITQDALGEVDRLKRELRRSEDDFNQAMRRASDLQSQVAQLQAAAGERDEFKQQLESALDENQRLRDQVANFEAMTTIDEQVAAIRGLDPQRAVTREFMTRAELRAYLADSIGAAYTDEVAAYERAILDALDMDYASVSVDEQIDSLAKGLLGFYDQQSKHLVVITDRSRMSIGDQVTYAHEYTHNLQDQHYNLTGMLYRAIGNSDYMLAIRALVEGDATMTMYAYADQHLSTLDKAYYKLEQFQNLDLAALVARGDAGGPIVESAGAFPYVEGMAFVAYVYERGGWEAVHQAFVHPPRSTEQILHPEKYYAGDDPVSIVLPDLGWGVGGSWYTLADDTLGELYLRIYLERYVPVDQAVAAGSGWGGDRYQVLVDDAGRTALALRTTWDTQADAAEFADAYAQFVAGRAGGAPALLQSRVGSVRWQLADRQYYLSRVGNQVLVLHAPDGPTLDALLGQLPGF